MAFSLFILDIGVFNIHISLYVKDKSIQGSYIYAGKNMSYIYIYSKVILSSWSEISSSTGTAVVIYSP